MIKLIKFASYLPEWLYGRKVLIDIALLYVLVNAMKRGKKWEA